MDIRNKYKVVYFINQIFGLYFSYGSPAKFRGGDRTLFPIIKIGLYDCQGMLFRGSYSLLLV